MIPTNCPYHPQRNQRKSISLYGALARSAVLPGWGSHYAGNDVNAFYTALLFATATVATFASPFWGLIGQVVVWLFGQAVACIDVAFYRK